MKQLKAAVKAFWFKHVYQRYPYEAVDSDIFGSEKDVQDFNKLVDEAQQREVDRQAPKSYRNPHA